MNKQDLIAAVADSSGLTKGDASKAVEAVFEAITGSLKKGGEVRLVGFGTFAVSKRKASTGRNPRTGETMTIAASNQPKFKAGKALKDAVNSQADPLGEKHFGPRRKLRPDLHQPIVSMRMPVAIIVAAAMDVRLSKVGHVQFGTGA